MCNVAAVSDGLGCTVVCMLCVELWCSSLHLHFATQEMTLRVACHIKSNMGKELQRLDFEKPLAELEKPIAVDISISKDPLTQVSRQVTRRPHTHTKGKCL